MSFLIYLTDRKTEKGKKAMRIVLVILLHSFSSEVESITTHNQQSIDLIKLLQCCIVKAHCCCC